jgi:hypothetical protein
VVRLFFGNRQTDAVGAVEPVSQVRHLATL